VSGPGRLTMRLAGHGSRTSRNAARQGSRTRRVLPAPTAAPPNPCRGGRGPDAPGRWCRHRDAVRKLRKCIGSDPRSLPRGGAGSWPTRAAGPSGGTLRTSHDMGRTLRAQDVGTHRESFRNTDRITRGMWLECERPAKRHITRRSISGRYLRGRSVTIPWRSITQGIPTARYPRKQQNYPRCGRCGRYLAGLSNKMNADFSP
jgi:hypothetical protein